MEKACRVVELKKVQGAALVTTTVAASLVLANSAFAAITWTGVELNTADVEGYMAIAVVGLAVLWGLRKVVKMMNRT